MTEPTLIIYCAGNQGRVVLDILRRGGRDGQSVFIDDVKEPEAEVDGVEVVGGHAEFDRFDPDRDRCIVTYSDRRGVRLELVERVREYGFEFFSAIDPEATISSRAEIGEGVILNAGSYVGPGVSVEEHAVVDSCVNISHDVSIQRGATVTPNVTLAGGVIVSTDAYIGAGATVIDDVTVGDGALVGAGAVVTEDVPPDTTVVGVPAEKLPQ